MATTLELLSAAEDPNLNKIVRVSCIIAADAVFGELDTVLNHANRKIWAKAVFQNPVAESQRMLWSVLAQNKAATLAQILAATDATVLANVMASIDRFATGTA